MPVKLSIIQSLVKRSHPFSELKAKLKSHSIFLPILCIDLSHDTHQQTCTNKNGVGWRFQNTTLKLLSLLFNSFLFLFSYSSIMVDSKLCLSIMWDLPPLTFCPPSHILSTLHPSLLVSFIAPKRGSCPTIYPFSCLKSPLNFRDFPPISMYSGLSVSFIFLLTGFLPMA